MLPFYHLDHFPPLPMEFVTPAFSADYTSPEPDSSDHKIMRTIYAAESKFKRTKFCYDLFKQFGPVHTYYFKNNPMSMYDFHSDIDRNCAINFLLTDVPSLTLFLTPTDIRLNSNIDNVQSKLYQPVLLDTSKKHGVINYSDQPRYILTVGLVNRSVTFLDVKGFLEQYPASNDIYK